MSRTDTEYRWGHLSEDCLQQWADLTNLLATVDETDEFLEAEDLAETMRSPTCTPQRDSWGIWSGSELVGIGSVLVPESLSNEGIARAFVFGGIHPDYRGWGLGQTLIAKQEERSRELAQQRHPGCPISWFADGGIPGAQVRAMLDRRGYQVARYFAHMVRPVPGELVTLHSDMPADVRLFNPRPQMSEALRLVHNLAFRDHWGSGERTETAWKEERESRTDRPQFSSVAIDAHGSPLSYVWASQWVPRELYIDAVGTDPKARGRGLARACLARTLRLAADSGQYDKLDLGVDSASPTGATRLYEDLGFRVDRTFALYQRPVTGTHGSSPA